MIHLRFVVQKEIVIEETKKKKIRKNFIQGEINEYDHDHAMIKVVSSMFKKQKLFFVNVGASAQSFCLLVVDWNQTNTFVVLCHSVIVRQDF